VLPGYCPKAAAPTPALLGWMGCRPDHQVYACIQAVAEIARRFSPKCSSNGWRSVRHSDALTPQVKPENAPDGLLKGIDIRDVTSCVVALLAPASLPNDGKAFEDARSHQQPNKLKALKRECPYVVPSVQPFFVTIATYSVRDVDENACWFCRACAHRGAQARPGSKPITFVVPSVRWRSD
jgi:hypothetical protein